MYEWKSEHENVLNITAHKGNTNLTTMRYNYTAIRMTRIKKTMPCVGMDVEKLKLSRVGGWNVK